MVIKTSNQQVVKVHERKSVNLNLVQSTQSQVVSSTRLSASSWQQTSALSNLSSLFKGCKTPSLICYFLSAYWSLNFPSPLSSATFHLPSSNPFGRIQCGRWTRSLFRPPFFSLFEIKWLFTKQYWHQSFHSFVGPLWQSVWFKNIAVPPENPCIVGGSVSDFTTFSPT